MPLKNTLAAYLPRSRSAKRQSSILGVAALALAGSAILVNRRAAKAERTARMEARIANFEETVRSALDTLMTSAGTMQGSYFCVAEDGTRFDVEIPAFVLDDGTSRVLH